MACMTRCYLCDKILKRVSFKHINQLARHQRVTLWFCYSLHWMHCIHDLCAVCSPYPCESVGYMHVCRPICRLLPIFRSKHFCLFSVYVLSVSQYGKYVQSALSICVSVLFKMSTSSSDSRLAWLSPPSISSHLPLPESQIENHIRCMRVRANTVCVCVCMCNKTVLKQSYLNNKWSRALVKHLNICIHA